LFCFYNAFKVSRRFGAIFRVHVQVRTANNQETSVKKKTGRIAKRKMILADVEGTTSLASGVSRKLVSL
jgi:hypothetical protein